MGARKSASFRFPQSVTAWSRGALKLILEPIFEADFQAGSYGYRPKRTAHETIARVVLRLGHNKTIGVIANRLCHLIWIILHNGVRYEERGPAVSKQSQQRHTARMIRKLRMLGHRIEPIGGAA